jgi:hypothetical protein
MKRQSRELSMRCELCRPMLTLADMWSAHSTGWESLAHKILENIDSVYSPLAWVNRHSGYFVTKLSQIPSFRDSLACHGGNGLQTMHIQPRHKQHHMSPTK